MPELKSAALTGTTFCADCSPLNVMIKVDEEGHVLEDMRARFLHDLLTLGVAEYMTGKPPSTARDKGYAKYYRVLLSAFNLAKMQARAAADPSGPIARFLQLLDALDAVPELARSPLPHVCAWIRIDPEGSGADTEHGDDALAVAEKPTGRTRMVTKNTRGRRVACARTRFRRKNKAKGGSLVRKGDGSACVATAAVPSSHAGSTYGGAAKAMGAEQVPGTATSVACFNQHEPQPLAFEGEEGEEGEEEGEEGEEALPPLAPYDAAESAWTISVIIDRIELTPAAQQLYVAVHEQQMAFHSITRRMVERPWLFLPPQPEEIDAVASRRRGAAVATTAAADGGGGGDDDEDRSGGGQPCDLKCASYANKSEEDKLNMSKASLASRAANAAAPAAALAPYFPGGEAQAANMMKAGSGQSVAREHAYKIFKKQNPEDRSSKMTNASQNVDWAARGCTPEKKAMAMALQALAGSCSGAGGRGSERARLDAQLQRAAAEEADAGEPPSLPEDSFLQCFRVDGTSCPARRERSRAEFVLSPEGVWHLVQPQCGESCREGGTKKRGKLWLAREGAGGSKVRLSEKQAGVEFVYGLKASKWKNARAKG